MYWLIPLGIVAGTTWLMSTENEVKRKTYSLLEKNFRKLKNKLKEENKTKVLIVGQPGAGKSSLLKYVTNNKCAPVPIIGQKTDATHWNDIEINDFFHQYSDQLFVDSPGYDTKNHPLDSYLECFPFSLFDKVIFVLHRKIYNSDMEIIKKINNNTIIIIRNYSECLTNKEKKEIKLDILKKFELNNKKIDIVFFSSKTKEGLSKLKNILDN